MKNLFAILTIFVMALTACVTDKDEPEWSLQAGDPVPQFSVTLSDGSVFDSAIDLPAAIVFFNTTCPDCRHELPSVQVLYDSGTVRVVCISREEDAGAIEAYWQANGLTMPYSAQTSREIYSLFASSGIPRIYFVDSDGVITGVRN